MTKGKFTAGKKVPVFLLLMLGLVLALTACGEENTAATNTDFTLPLYQGATEYANLNSDATFRQALFATKRANFTGEEYKVYTTGSALADTKNWYISEMVKKGWQDRSREILGDTALDTSGWVLGFVKQDHVVGVIMVSGPSANKADILSKFQGSLPSDGKNILIITQSVYKAVPTPSK